MASKIIQDIIEQREWTGKDFANWFDSLDITQKEAASLLGKGVRQIRNHLREPDKEIPRSTRLACCYVHIKVAVETKKIGEGALQ